MTAKNKILLFLGIAMLAISAVLKSRGINAVPIIGASVIAMFLVFALVGAPKKHKKYTYEDQKEAMHHSLGGNAPPEVHPPRDINEKNIAG